MTAFLANNPMATFALVLGLSVLVPPLVRRLRLPDLVGLLLAGVLLLVLEGASVLILVLWHCRIK